MDAGRMPGQPAMMYFMQTQFSVSSDFCHGTVRVVCESECVVRCVCVSHGDGAREPQPVKAVSAKRLMCGFALFAG